MNHDEAALALRLKRFIAANEQLLHDLETVRSLSVCPNALSRQAISATWFGITEEKLARALAQVNDLRIDNIETEAKDR